MTNPFRKPEKPEWEDIDNAELYCRACSTMSTKGRFNESTKKVWWQCSECGLNNEETVYG